MKLAAFVPGIALVMVFAGCATTGHPHAAVAPDVGLRLVAGATALIGQPYRYGGAEPGGFDCSGLVFYAAGRAGLRVPRTAQEQMHAGVPIARRELRAGDLVFMHLARKELHVGIAIDADRFVHAPSTGGRIRIDSLAVSPYAHGFVRARRVVDEIGTDRRELQ